MISSLPACIDSLGQLTVNGEVNTPCGVAEVEFIDPREPVKVVPILRAGLVLIEQAASVLPANQTFHLGKSYVRCLFFLC
ncbi:hypothetical protein M758_10G013600 [Ceratodon purpureus]|nr:hypothetical protein M758_10G013600 [Ceratodon purpureus]